MRPAWDPLENEWQAEVVKAAKLGGWRVYHTYNSKRSVKGFPDLVLVRDSTIFAELKTNAGKVGAEQEEWLAALARAGQEVYVWRPGDFEEVRATLLRPRRS